MSILTVRITINELDFVKVRLICCLIRLWEMATFFKNFYSYLEVKHIYSKVHTCTIMYLFSIYLQDNYIVYFIITLIEEDF